MGYACGGSPVSRWPTHLDALVDVARAPGLVRLAAHALEGLVEVARGGAFASQANRVEQPSVAELRHGIVHQDVAVHGKADLRGNAEAHPR